MDLAPLKLLSSMVTRELVNCPYVGALPPAIQSITMFSGAVSRSGRDPAGARALLEFMASPDVTDVKLRHGMQAA